LAGVGAGLLQFGPRLAEVVKVDRSFHPEMGTDERATIKNAWRDALRRARSPR
jgi:hypothetical protein